MIGAMTSTSEGIAVWIVFPDRSAREPASQCSTCLVANSRPSCSTSPNPSAAHSVRTRYLEQLRRIKSAVKVPVVASLNSTSAETWLTFAQQMEQAGADALELNMYDVVTDPKQSGAAIERGLTSVNGLGST
jgi:2-methylisocitrate lyase-like PEP mutase family enzyme